MMVEKYKILKNINFASYEMGDFWNNRMTFETEGTFGAKPP